LVPQGSFVYRSDFKPLEQFESGGKGALSEWKKVSFEVSVKLRASGLKLVLKVVWAFAAPYAVKEIVHLPMDSSGNEDGISCRVRTDRTFLPGRVRLANVQP
jgi:hypothetical protein